MILEELYINDSLIQLAEESRVGLNLQANNIGELQNRQGDYTNQFKIPKSKANRIILENMDNVNSSTLIPYRLNTARYVIAGIDQVQEGVATVISSDERFYTVQVNSGNTNFFALVPDLKVREMDWSDLIHVWDIPTIKASRFNTSGYIYAMIDWHDYASSDSEFSTNRVDARYMVATLFVKDILKRSCENYTGYTLHGSFYDSPLLANMILTPDTLSYTEEKAALLNGSLLKVGDASLGAGIFSGTFYPVFQTAQGEGFSLPNNYHPLRRLSGVIRVFGRLQIVNPSPGLEKCKVIVEIYKQSNNAAVCSNIVFNGPTISDELSFDSNSFIITDPDEIYGVRFVVSTTYGPIDDLIIKDGTTFRFDFSGDIGYKSTMPIGECYNITIKKVWQDVLNQRGVIVQTDTNKKRVYLDFFDDLTANITQAKDWSNKVDVNRIKVNYKFGKYAILNDMVYQPSTGYTYFGLGDHSFRIDDETLPDKLTVVKMATSATEMQYRYKNIGFPRIKAMNSARAFDKRVNNRLLMLDRKDTDTYWFYTEGPGYEVSAINGVFPYATFEPLRFSRLVDDHYSTLISMLNKTKGITVGIDLTPQDIQELDYLIPIYLDIHTPLLELNGYFYLNKISNYQGGVTNCELFRM